MTGEGSGKSPAPPDVWGTAVASGDALKLSQMVLDWSASKPEVALSLLRSCVTLLEKDLHDCVAEPAPSLSVPHGRARSLRLEAITAVVNQTFHGKSWFTSMKELQLVSLDVCAACRSVTTLRLRVNHTTPRRLLAAADAPAPSRKRLCSTRVARLRARGVWWDLPTAAELKIPIFALADARSIWFHQDFGGSLEGIAWPNQLESLSFNYDGRYNMPIANVAWPASLHTIEFGIYFNQPIQRAKWPASLQHLSFGDKFNQPVEGVTWPNSIKCISFGDKFDQPIEGVTWSEEVQELVLGDEFDQPIENVVWPARLKYLTFGVAFNQPVEAVMWPASLQKLTFGQVFNQPMDGVTWPVSLRSLTLGIIFETLPPRGGSISSNFDQAIHRAVWPASFRKLTLGDDFQHPLQGLGTWIPSLEELHFFPADRADYRNLLGGIEWPKGLRQLGVCEDAILDGVAIPPGVEVLRSPWTD